MATFKLLSRLVLMAVLGGVSGVSMAEIIGKDDRRIITDPNEFSAVGFLRVRKDRNKKGVWLSRVACTGTIISNKAVLFARHCIDELISGDELVGGEVDFFPAFRGDSNDHDLYQWQGISIKHIISYKSKNAGNPYIYIRENSNDFMVGLLEQSISDYIKEKGENFLKIAPLKIFSDPTLRIGETISLPAYSDFKDDSKFSVHENCHVLKSDKWADEYNAEDIGRPDDTLNFSELVFNHDCNTSEGSSGAPLLVKRNNTYFIIGVHIGHNIGRNSYIPDSNLALGVYTIFHDLLPFKYPKISWSKIFSE